VEPITEAEAKAAIAEAKQRDQDAEREASDARTAQDGWPIFLADGTEVQAVKTLPQAAGGVSHVLDADGNEYRPLTKNPANGYTLYERDEAPAEAEASDEASK
jgi:hypothetical protein